MRKALSAPATHGVAALGTWEALFPDGKWTVSLHGSVEKYDDSNPGKPQQR